MNKIFSYLSALIDSTEQEMKKSIFKKGMWALTTTIMLHCITAKGATVIQTTDAGNLSSQYPIGETAIVIKGPINGTDIGFLRRQIADSGLTSIDLSEARIVSGGNPYLDSHQTEDDVIGEEMFANYTQLQQATIPKSTKRIESKAFSHSGLKKIEIPDNTTEIGFDAFAYCNSLDTVIIGKKVQRIQQGAFYSSSVKTAYTKPATPPEIANYLFSSQPSIHVYSEPQADYEESDWAGYGSIIADLDLTYPQTDTTEIIRGKLATYFSDAACTQLRPEYSQLSNDALVASMNNDEMPSYIIDIALKIKNESWMEYEKDFRIHSYHAYSDANYWNDRLKSSGGSYMGNPTGIYAASDEPLYVFVDQGIPQNATLYISGCTGNNLISNAKSGYKLRKGLNVVDGEGTALYYIVYTADTKDQSKKIAEWPEIKIHIEGGKVNGYYEPGRHTEADYTALLNNATHEFFTVKGKEALFNFKTSTYKTHLPNPIDESIAWFDSLTVWEKELMGICESVASGRKAGYPFYLTGGEAFFPSYYNNPNFAIEGKEGDSGYANSSTYRTSYNSKNCISASFDVTKDDHDDWCVAHECGHNNQSAINLEGGTEVSNNLFSNYICFIDGRIASKGSPLSATMNDYAKHTPYFVRNITSMMRMYYQLYLYYHQAQKNTAFYPTLFQELRKDPLTLWGDADNSSLKFVRKVCEVAQEDLTDFFAAWGFFEPCDLTIDDYGVHSFSVHQEAIDKTMEEISKYEKKNRAILFVEDRAQPVPSTGVLTPESSERSGNEVVGRYANLGQFTDYLSESATPSDYTYRQTDSLYAMAGHDGVGFIVLNNNGKMLYAANTLNFRIPSSIKEEFTIYSVDADGTLHETTKTGSGTEIATISIPGTLADSASTSVIKFIIKGDINGTDLRFLHQLASEGNLQSIDLSQANIIEGGDLYFEGCEAKENTVGDYLFHECPNLVSVILPSSATAIGERAFSHSGIDEISIPDEVTTIGFDAFAYCDNLSKVTIGTNVNRISQGAFYSSPVEHIYVKTTTPPSVSNYLFSSEPIIHVYAEAVSDFENSDWAKFGTIIGDLDDWSETSSTTLTQIGKNQIGNDWTFDLFGRRISRPRASRIYIRNGMKSIYKE